MKISNGFTCFKCHQFINGTFACLSKHLRDQHYIKTKNSARNSLECGQRGCSEKFKTFSSYRHHLSVCDKVDRTDDANNEDDIILDNNFEPANRLDEGEIDMQILKDNMHHQNEKQPAGGIHMDYEGFDLTKSIALFLMNMKADHNATHVMLNSVSTGLKQIFIDLRETFVVGPENDKTCGLINQFLASFSKLGTQYSRTKYFKENFGLNEAVAIDMGGVKQQVMRSGGVEHGREQIPSLIPNIFHYIPLRDTLSSLFNNKNFKNCYFNESVCTNGGVQGHRDSKHFHTHPLFSKNPHALRLQLFQDDVETTNALGSKTKKRGELAMFTFTVLNMPRETNSLLSSIFPFAVCRTNLIKKIGFEPVLRELMKEIALLESDEGMLLNIDDSPGFRIRGTIASVCGDSKGMHELFGFMSCSADKFCRLCLISRSQISSCTTLDKLDPRNRTNYDEAVLKVITQGYPDPTTGVAGGCLLNQSKFWHVTENIIMDAMHDVLEGLVPFIVKLSLREFQSRLGITAELLNSRISHFKYTRKDQSNKPSPKFTSENLRQEGNYNTKQRASQNWCLIRMLPLLIGDKIPRNDKHFDLILHLLCVMDIIFSPEIHTGHVALLKDLMQQLFEKQSRLYPFVNLINKFHHFLHYLEMMALHGPPTSTWCMRFEGYHNKVKKRAQSINNFRNLSKSIAEHCNVVLCSNLLDPYFCSPGQIYFGPTETYSLPEIVSKYSLENHHHNFQVDLGITVARWLKIGGFEYHKNSVIVLEKCTDTLDCYPTFGVIKTIFVQENEVSFLVSKCYTEDYDDHFHGYSVRELIEIQFVLWKDLYKLEPLNFLNNSVVGDNNSYILPRHSI